MSRMAKLFPLNAGISLVVYAILSSMSSMPDSATTPVVVFGVWAVILVANAQIKAYLQGSQAFVAFNPMRFISEASQVMLRQQWIDEACAILRHSTTRCRFPTPLTTAFPRPLQPLLRAMGTTLPRLRH